jgi:DNA-binding YbaB/EbfC family protein
MELNMNEIMEQAKKMQEKMQEIQDSLVNLKVVGEAGNGLVRVILNGRHECLKVFLDSSLLGKSEAEHKQYVEELVAAAINHASDQIEGASQEHLKGLASSLNLPQNPEDVTSQG